MKEKIRDGSEPRRWDLVFPGLPWSNPKKPSDLSDGQSGLSSPAVADSVGLVKSIGSNHD